MIQFLVVYYTNILQKGYLQEFRSVLQQSILVLLIIVAFLLITQMSSMFSRQVIIIMGICGERLVWKNAVRKTLWNSVECSQILVISEWDKILNYIRELEKDNQCDGHRSSISFLTPAINLQSPGLVFFPDPGGKERKFKIYKFRTMYRGCVGTEEVTDGSEQDEWSDV